jgi:hypothetical protein
MLLWKYKDVRGWNYKDLKRIPFHNVEHQVKLDMTLGHQCIMFNVVRILNMSSNKTWTNCCCNPKNFIHKDTVDLENVQANKKKEKGEFTRRQN